MSLRQAAGRDIGPVMNGSAFIAVIAAIFGGVLFAAAVERSGLHILRVTTGSMAPAIQPGDWVLELDRPRGAAAWAQRGDVVLFRFPFDSDERAIKRVIGLPGDRVVIEQTTIAINGGRAHIAGAPSARAAGPRTETVTAGTVFLLGDNAEGSIDSRDFGAVPERQILGQVLLPLQRWVVWLSIGVLAAAWFAMRLRKVDSAR
jgi:signal peptidase I